MTCANRTACVMVVLTLQCGRAAAQTAAIEPDRPDSTNGPHLVAGGTVQFELGGIFARERSHGHTAAAPVSVRIGVSNGFEARFGIDNQFSATGENQTFGTVQAGAKIRVWSDSRGVALVSILPTVYVPTDGGDPDVWVVVATGADFGPRVHLDVNYGATGHATSEGRPRLFQQLLAASVSISPTARWSGYLEMYGNSRETADGAAAVAFDTGVQYFIRPHVVADAGVDFGISGDSPTISVFAGLTFALRPSTSLGTSGRGRATSASRSRGRG